MTSPNDKLPIITVDSEANDDWIRSLPSAESERKITAQLVEDLKKKKADKKPS